MALDRLLIEQLPQIVREAADGLAKADLTVLNGADGLGEVAAGLVGQGMAIFDSVRRSMEQDAGKSGPQSLTAPSGPKDEARRRDRTAASGQRRRRPGPLRAAPRPSLPSSRTPTRVSPTEPVTPS